MSYESSFDQGRVFSTLGNPALLASYALFICLMMRARGYAFYLSYSLAFIVILITQTWWVFVVLILSGVYELSLLKRTNMKVLLLIII